MMPGRETIVTFSEYTRTVQIFLAYEKVAHSCCSGSYDPFILKRASERKNQLFKPVNAFVLQLRVVMQDVTSNCTNIHR